MKAIVYGCNDEFDGWKDSLGVLTDAQAKAAAQAVEQANQLMAKKHGKKYFIELRDVDEAAPASAREIFNQVQRACFGI